MLEEKTSDTASNLAHRAFLHIQKAWKQVDFLEMISNGALGLFLDVRRLKVSSPARHPCSAPISHIPNQCCVALGAPERRGAQAVRHGSGSQ